jgi:hypothetical protein
METEFNGSNSQGWEVVSRQIEGGLYIIAFDTYGNCIGNCVVDNLVESSVYLKRLSNPSHLTRVSIEELFS